MSNIELHTVGTNIKGKLSLLSRVFILMKGENIYTKVMARKEYFSLQSHENGEQNHRELIFTHPIE